MSKAAGRAPAAPEVIVRANLHLTAHPLGQDRSIFSGSLDQVKADIDSVRVLGADELVFDPSFSSDGETPEKFLACMERIRQLL